MQVVPASSPYRFKAVSCAVLGGDAVQVGKEIVKGQRLDELQAYGLGSLDHKTPRQGIAALQGGCVGIVPGGESAVRAAARVGGDTAGRDGDGGLGGHALRLGDVEGHRLLCQLGQLDGLVHIGGRNTDRAGGRLIAKLADGVGVVGILGSDIDILAFFAVRRLLVNGGVSLFQCYRRIIGGKLQGNDRQLDKGNGNGVVPLLGGKLLRYLFVAFLFHRIGVFFANCQGITSVCTRCQAGVALFQRHSGINCRSCRILDIKAHGGQHLGAEIAQPNAILPLVPAAIFSVVYGDLIPGIYSDGKLFPILLFTTVSAAG